MCKGFLWTRHMDTFPPARPPLNYTCQAYRGCVYMPCRHLPACPPFPSPPTVPVVLVRILDCVSSVRLSPKSATLATKQRPQPPHTGSAGGTPPAPVAPAPGPAAQALVGRLGVGSAACPVPGAAANGLPEEPPLPSRAAGVAMPALVVLTWTGARPGMGEAAALGGTWHTWRGPKAWWMEGGPSTASAAAAADVAPPPEAPGRAPASTAVLLPTLLRPVARRHFRAVLIAPGAPPRQAALPSSLHDWRATVAVVWLWLWLWL